MFQMFTFASLSMYNYFSRILEYVVCVHSYVYVYIGARSRITQRFNDKRSNK